MSKIQRTQLHPSLEEKKDFYLSLFDVLQNEGLSHWYCSLWVEKRDREIFRKNPQKESYDFKPDGGLVFRIFDGQSLFEEATDETQESILTEKARSFVARVKRNSLVPQGAPKAYDVPNWAQRLDANLEEEVVSQIPKEVSFNTWVHFGSAMQESLFSQKTDGLEFCSQLFSRVQDYSVSLAADDVAKSPDTSMALLDLQTDHFLFIDSETRLTQSLKRNRAVIQAHKNGESAHFLQGGIGGLETLVVGDVQIKGVFDDLRKSLKAEKLTPGRYQVLMSPAITGVFAHEAFGHSQEADTWARGRSKARELYESGERVGNEHATILNNPAIYKNGEDDFGAWGSYFFDEEGWLAQSQDLVKEGVLCAPMTNLTSALRLNVPRSANGKRERWTNGIYSRQTNTYFSAGTSTYQEMISQMDYGFLASVCHGGMEDPKGMGIQVGIGFVEEIKDGQLTGRTFKAPNGGAVQLTGYVPDYLKSIVAKSKIEAFSENEDKVKHPWNEVGGCGKYHKEIVNAGTGGTYLLINDCLLG